MTLTRLSALAAAALLATGAQAQNLSIAFADPISSVDPQLNNHAGDRSLALHFWDSIINSRDGGKLEPALASSWRLVDDKTWEFKLRNDVTWQDGKPFTADDIVFSFQRARNVPGSVASYAGALRSVESVTAKDPHTVIIKTGDRFGSGTNSHVFVQFGDGQGNAVNSFLSSRGHFTRKKVDAFKIKSGVYLDEVCQLVVGHDNSHFYAPW